MTKEEAIGRLADMANEIRDYCDYTKHMTEEAKYDLEAFNMAIKALEERPKGKWISKYRPKVGKSGRYNCPFYEHIWSESEEE